MRNRKQFLAALLAATMTLQANVPALAETTDNFIADGLQEEMQADADAQAENPADADEPVDSFEELQEEPVEVYDDFGGEELPGLSSDEDFEEDALETEADGLIEDAAMEDELASQDEFAQAEVEIDASLYAPFSRRTKQEVAEKYVEALYASEDYTSGNPATYYAEGAAASLTAPYAQGTLADSTLAAMNSLANYYRWLAGESAFAKPETKNTETYQYRALDRNFDYRRTVSVSNRPSDMDENLWKLGTTSTFNLLAKGMTPTEAITYWMNKGYIFPGGTADTLEGSRTRLIGGTVSGVYFGYSGQVAIGSDKLGSANTIEGPFAAFPAPGYTLSNVVTPNGTGWSVYLNEDYASFENASLLKVRVTDMSTGSSYICTRADGTLRGISGAGEVHFQAPSVSGRYTAPYKVEIIGLSDPEGRSVKITYTVKFVDMDDVIRTSVASYSIHASKVFTTDAGGTAWLNKVKATMPSSVYALLENGREIELPVAGEWTLDQANGVFTANVDLSALPENVSVSAELGTSISVPYVQLGISQELSAMKLQIVPDTVVEGNTVTFSTKRAAGSVNRAEIYKLTESEEGVTGAKVFDSRTSSDFVMEGSAFTFSKEAEMEDSGTYLAVQYFEPESAGTAADAASVVYGMRYVGASAEELAVIGKELEFTVEAIPAQRYTGAFVTPSVTVEDGDTLLREGIDYSIEYVNNKAVGTAQAVVTGLGDYEGVTKTAEFMIGFADVQDSTAYYFKPVYWAVQKGITNGYDEDNTFRPQDTCTRGQMVTFLWRLAGKPAPKTRTNPFTDVSTKDYYYRAVLWAAEKGITKGYSEDNTFRPNEACQREHAVMFLWRLAGKPTPKTAVNPFTDITKKDYYYLAALWASENKIARGYNQEDGTTKYQPKDDCMREHIVTFLYRYASML